MASRRACWASRRACWAASRACWAAWRGVSAGADAWRTWVVVGTLTFSTAGAGWAGAGVLAAVAEAMFRTALPPPVVGAAVAEPERTSHPTLYWPIVITTDCGAARFPVAV